MNCLEVEMMTTEVVCQSCSDEKQIQNIQQLMIEQQRPKVSIK